MEKNGIFREISLEGAEKIGEGAHGEVYRIDEETIAKVYRDSEPLEKIRKEKDIVYGCRCVYDEGKRLGLELPLFYGNMDKVFSEIKIDS